MIKVSQNRKISFVLLPIVMVSCALCLAELAWANAPQKKHAPSKPKLIRQSGIIDSGQNSMPSNASQARKTPSYPSLPSAHVQPTSQPRKQIYKLNMPLQGGVVENVPYTPEGVTKYLIKMRSIIRSYKNLIAQELSGGVMGVVNNAESLRQESIATINRIHTTIPPEDLKNRHNELATKLGVLSQYLHDPSLAGTGMAAVENLLPAVDQACTTLSRYHAGVKECIAYYGLSDDLDPLYGESDVDALSALNNAKAHLTQGDANGLAGLMGGLAGGGNSHGDSHGDSLGIGGFGGGDGSSTPSISDVMKMLGSLGSSNGSSSQGSQGLENIDLNGLMKQLGGADPNALNSILQGLGGN